MVASVGSDNLVSSTRTGTMGSFWTIPDSIKKAHIRESALRSEIEFVNLQPEILAIVFGVFEQTSPSRNLQVAKPATQQRM
jgi:hypothetical protein